MAVSKETIDKIVEYYANLLIIQYHDLPKAKAMVTLFVYELVAQGIIFEVRDGFAIETAIGVQLDALAKYIGVDRFFAEQVLNNFFSFVLYDDPDEIYASEVGYCDYTDLNKPGNFLTYDDILSSTFALTDAEFRTLLKLKILQNNSNHSTGEIVDGVWALFGDTLIPQDNYDMTMNYIVDASILPLIEVAYDKGILPKPMGVAINLITSTA